MAVAETLERPPVDRAQEIADLNALAQGFSLGPRDGVDALVAPSPATASVSISAPPPVSTRKRVGRSTPSFEGSVSVTTGLCISRVKSTVPLEGSCAWATPKTASATAQPVRAMQCRMSRPVLPARPV